MIKINLEEQNVQMYRQFIIFIIKLHKENKLT